MASTLRDPITLLHDTLETQYQKYIDQLTRLTVSRAGDNHNGHDQATLAKIAATRQAVADTALALRRLAEGTYGTCEHCGDRIPVHRLRAVPYTRFCLPCQRIGPTIQVS